MTGQPTTSMRYWIVHPGHPGAPWPAELRRELVAAFRRGTMDAARCLGTYRLHGESSMLPPEAVIYLATRVVADGSKDTPSWERYDGRVTSEILSEHGERELAALVEGNGEELDWLVESGRRFFFPGPFVRG